MSTTALTAYRFVSSAKLAGAHCSVCGAHVCPPRLRHCDRPMEEVALDATGTVEAYSTVHVAPSEHPTPYRIAYVRLGAGPRVFAKIAPDFPEETDPVGREVRLVHSAEVAPGQSLLIACPAEVRQ